MGKTYKDSYVVPPHHKTKIKRHKTKGALKELPKKLKGKEDPYNSMEDFYEEDNFEKFNRKR